jgi:transcriptional regulator with XRE-family HTH domain
MALQQHAIGNGTAQISVPRDDIKERRKALGLSQRELAEKVGSHAQTIDKIERGQITFSRYLSAIEETLSLWPKATWKPPEAKDERQDVEKIPIYATSAVTLRTAVMFQEASEPIHHVLPPACLRGKRSSYGGIVSSDAMSPIFTVGDSFYCNPHLAPAPGKFVLLRQKQPWQRGQVILCQLVSFTEREWRVLLLNSGKDKRPHEQRLTFTRADFPIAHIIVSKDFA